jgi:uroporphyrinogen-III synthase
VVLCRAEADGGALVDELRRLGAEPVLVPLHKREAAADGGAALEAALSRLDHYHWLALTSANGVRAVSEALTRAGAQPLPPGLRVAVVGTATGAACQAAGFPVDLIPPVATAADLAAAFPPPPALGHAPAPRVLAPLAEAASSDLETGLTQRGYEVDRVDAYRMAPTTVDVHRRALVEGADAVLLTAPSLVDRFVEMFSVAAVPPVAVAIGPRTAERARHRGIAPVVAASHDQHGLVDALLTALGD